MLGIHSGSSDGITESSTDPPTHRPYHRPTWSVMRSVNEGRWVGVVEWALLQGRLAVGGYYWVGWCRFWSIIT